MHYGYVCQRGYVLHSMENLCSTLAPSPDAELGAWIKARVLRPCSQQSCGWDCASIGLTSVSRP